jgi:hypothetical protein
MSEDAGRALYADIDDLVSAQVAVERAFEEQRELCQFAQLELEWQAAEGLSKALVGCRGIATSIFAFLDPCNHVRFASINRRAYAIGLSLWTTAHRVTVHLFGMGLGLGAGACNWNGLDKLLASKRVEDLLSCNQQRKIQALLTMERIDWWETDYMSPSQAASAAEAIDTLLELDKVAATVMPAAVESYISFRLLRQRVVIALGFWQVDSKRVAAWTWACLPRRTSHSHTQGEVDTFLTDAGAFLPFSNRQLCGLDGEAVLPDTQAARRFLEMQLHLDQLHSSGHTGAVYRLPPFTVALDAPSKPSVVHVHDLCTRTREINRTSMRYYPPNVFTTQLEEQSGKFAPISVELTGLSFQGHLESIVSWNIRARATRDDEERRRRRDDRLRLCVRSR